MSTYLALLRAVNVGGNNKLPMKALRDALEANGFSDVRTYIQSGNVIFHHPSNDENELRAQISALIQTEFGVKSPVVLRSRKELAATVEHSLVNVLPEEEKLYHVMFLGDTPTTEQIKSLDPNRSPNDRFVVRGRDIYVHYQKDVGSSKFTNSYVDSKLGTVSTARNWRTVKTLLNMLEETE